MREKWKRWIWFGEHVLQGRPVKKHTQLRRGL